MYGAERVYSCYLVEENQSLKHQSLEGFSFLQRADGELEEPILLVRNPRSEFRNPQLLYGVRSE